MTTKRKKAAPAKTAIKPPLKKKAQGKTPTPRQIERQIKLVLTQLLKDSDSDTIKIAAAKALMEKITKKPEDDKEAKAHEHEEHTAALAEARALLAELAAARTGGDARKAQVAQRRT